MAKYNRISEPLRLAKDMPIIAESQKIGDETTLKTLDKKRKYHESRDPELLQFGRDLYCAGYTLDEIRNDIKNYEELIKQGKRASNSQIFMYDGLECIPSIEKFDAIIKNPNMFMNIENGWNIERRIALGRELTSGIKR